MIHFDEVYEELDVWPVYPIGGVFGLQSGEQITVLERSHLKGYECFLGSDGVWRYDRSTHSLDAGRVTGTNHDYSCPENIQR